MSGTVNTKHIKNCLWKPLKSEAKISQLPLGGCATIDSPTPLMIPGRTWVKLKLQLGFSYLML